MHKKLTYISFCILFLIFINLQLARAQEEKNQKNFASVNEFALYLKEVIVSGDINNFKEIPCYPSGCLYSEDKVEKAKLEYVFGTENKPSVIKTILNLSNVNIKIIGPYEFEEGAFNESYSIVYFDPNQVTFTKDGKMTRDVRENLWWKGYVETVVTISNGKWGFQRVPFYYGTHLPWAP